jgi:hypothetical protein
MHIDAIEGVEQSAYGKLQLRLVDRSRENATPSGVDEQRPF